jgi:hypothetical protein
VQQHIFHLQTFWLITVPIVVYVYYTSVIYGVLLGSVIDVSKENIWSKNYDRAMHYAG